MLKNNRINDIVFSNTFFPSVSTSQGHKCSQLFAGEKNDFIHFETIKSESYSYLALQDFHREHGGPHVIKTGNVKTDKGAK